MLIDSVRDAVYCEINRLNMVKGKGVGPEVESIIDTSVARLEGIITFYLQDDQPEPRVAIVEHEKERSRNNEIFSENVACGGRRAYNGGSAGFIGAREQIR